MKLGPAEDGGRKLASAATPNHSDGSKDFSLCSTGSIRIKNEEKKSQRSSALICLSYFPTVFNNVLLKQNNKQWAKKGKKFCRPLKSMLGNFESVDRGVDEVDSGCDIFRLWYLQREKIIAWSYESITRVDRIVPPMNYLWVQSSSADSNSYQNCKCERALVTLLFEALFQTKWANCQRR